MNEIYFLFFIFLLCPDLKKTIPATSANSHTIRACRRARDSVIMTLECSNALALECVPCVAIKVIVTRKQDASAEREGHRCDTAHDTVVGIGHEFSISPYKKSLQVESSDPVPKANPLGKKL